MVALRIGNKALNEMKNLNRAIVHDLLNLLASNALINDYDKFEIFMKCAEQIRTHRMAKWYWEETLWEDLNTDKPLFDCEFNIDEFLEQPKTKISKN